MANTKISALPAASDVLSAELPIAQGGVTKKVTTALLNTHISNTFAPNFSTTGLVALATRAEVSAGTDAAKVLTPDTYRNAVPYYTARSSSFNLALTDVNTDQWCDGTITIGIPANATIAFPVGSTIPILRTGSGVVTIDATNSVVTLNGVLGGNCTIRSQYQGALLKKIALPDTWVISGDVSAVA